jgi:hypothetical protein
MAQGHGKRHVRLAVFGCIKCGRFVFAPSSYQLDPDVVVCECHASRYKTNNVRAPDHVQAYWDAQCKAAYSSYRRRLKHYALPSVHAERLATKVPTWSVLNVESVLNFDLGNVKEESSDLATSTLALSDSNSANSTTQYVSFQRHAISILHAWRSALVSGISRVADVERENKGKAS